MNNYLFFAFMKNMKSFDTVTIGLNSAICKEQGIVQRGNNYHTKINVCLIAASDHNELFVVFFVPFVVVLIVALVALIFVDGRRCSYQILNRKLLAIVNAHKKYSLVL